MKNVTCCHTNWGAEFGLNAAIASQTGLGAVFLLSGFALHGARRVWFLFQETMECFLTPSCEKLTF